jgi:Skp family chaperone for outer membrane proteins
MKRFPLALAAVALAAVGVTAGADAARAPQQHGPASVSSRADTTQRFELFERKLDEMASADEADMAEAADAAEAENEAAKEAEQNDVADDAAEHANAVEQEPAEIEGESHHGK